MRITQNMMSAVFVNNLRKQTEAMLQRNEQIATQKRINRPSDDPAGMARVLDGRSTLAADRAVHGQRRPGHLAPAVRGKHLEHDRRPGAAGAAHGRGEQRGGCPGRGPRARGRQRQGDLRPDPAAGELQIRGPVHVLRRPDRHRPLHPRRVVHGDLSRGRRQLPHPDRRRGRGHGRRRRPELLPERGQRRRRHFRRGAGPDHRPGKPEHHRGHRPDPGDDRPPDRRPRPDR